MSERRRDEQPRGGNGNNGGKVRVRPSEENFSVGVKAHLCGAPFSPIDKPKSNKTGPNPKKMVGMGHAKSGAEVRKSEAGGGRNQGGKAKLITSSSPWSSAAKEESLLRTGDHTGSPSRAAVQPWGGPGCFAKSAMRHRRDHVDGGQKSGG